MMSGFHRMKLARWSGRRRVSEHSDRSSVGRFGLIDGVMQAGGGVETGLCGELHVGSEVGLGVVRH